METTQKVEEGARERRDSGKRCAGPLLERARCKHRTVVLQHTVVRSGLSAKTAAILQRAAHGARRMPRRGLHGA